MNYDPSVKDNRRRCRIIAEAGVNHNGNIDIALQLCDEAKKSGADIVKFQTWNTDKIATKSSKQAEYQKKNTGIEESQYDMLKKLELSYESFNKIKMHCDSIGILFASTADEADSLDFLTHLGIPFIKVGSGEICNVPYLRYIGSKKLPVILSTGMSTLDDIDFSLNCLMQGGAKDITLLHCSTAYPCPYDQVNLRAMLTLQKEFNMPVGYSDHTIGDEIPVAAVSLGACVIEKHFTLDSNMDGPDHKASMMPEDFRRMVEKIRHIEAGMGTGKKVPTEAEQKNIEVVRKSIVAAQSIKKNDLLTESLVTVKRVGGGIDARYWDSVIGTRAKQDYLSDDLIIL